MLAQTDHSVEQLGRELDRYKVEIATLGETRLTEEGLLKEVGAGYNGADARKKSGVKQEYVSPSNHTLSASSQDFQKT